jgi:putative membrane protein
MTPAMLVAWASGLWLATAAGFFETFWLHAKLLLVALMTLTHCHFWRLERAFSIDANRHSGRYFRIWNEIPTLLMLGIVATVIVKPFD